MRLIFEEHQYKNTDIQPILSCISSLQSVDKKVSVNYVGYFYNTDINDCVFILPKVLLTDGNTKEGQSTEDEYIVDGDNKIDPAYIINPSGQHRYLSEEYRKFIYEFAIWIYRTLHVYRKNNPDSNVIFYKKLLQNGNGEKRHISTLLDVIFLMRQFVIKNQDFFFFKINNNHFSKNKINWIKTIKKNDVLIQNECPIYINSINKKHIIDFDEELFVMFYSILRYLNEKYGFNIAVNYNYNLLPNSVFLQYLHGFGKKRLRSIKYKYFSDTAIELWNLCYVFFEISNQLNVKIKHSEYLLAKNFNIIFEAIIDELIGDSKDTIPRGLKEQYDGKRVDHMYRYLALTADDECNKQIYYIGDSKYYKYGHKLGKESIYKQYTYARNVIQWNIDLFLNDEFADQDDIKIRAKDLNEFGNIRLRGDEKEDLTEGYNILPNFFISAFVEEDRKYDSGENIKNHIVERNGEYVHNTYFSYQFVNRLFDRDTLILSHYDVNFLYVIYLYARGKNSEKIWWKSKVRKLFRDEIRRVIEEKFVFRAMKPLCEGLDKEFFIHNFKDICGKVYTPYNDKTCYSLALDRSNPDGKNELLLAKLRKYFYVTDELKLGQNPMPSLNRLQEEDHNIYDLINHDTFYSIDEKCVLTGYVGKTETNIENFMNYSAKKFIMKYIPENINLLSAKYFMPMINGYMNGIYKISKISLKKEKDSNELLIYITFEGDYIKFGDKRINVYKKDFGSGQLHYLRKVIDVYLMNN